MSRLVHQATWRNSGPSKPAACQKLGADAVGQRRLEQVGDDDAFDHVADDGRPGATGGPDGDDGALRMTAQRAIDVGETWWTSEAGGNQASPTGSAPDGARRCREVQRGAVDGHAGIVAPGCHEVL
ncbi:MAG: hypothetical protein QM733_22855 [Ilumatobacteraceae bacterium]